MHWSYGVTTVPERRKTLLPKTLLSLKHAGFDNPRLFVDGDSDTGSWCREFGLDVTCRWPKIDVAANWVLSLAELYYRDHAAARYAIFQDDLLAYTNLRRYLEASPYPEGAYLNLYTFPSNQAIAKKVGWFEARVSEQPDGSPHPLYYQNGRGAVGLVFSREAVITLLSSRHIYTRATEAGRGHKKIDGGIVTAMNIAGWREWVHNPSLLQHTGTYSSCGNNPQLAAPSFRGTLFDAMELMKEAGYA